MTQVILDPTGEKSAAQRDPLPTPASLKDLTVGLLDISKVKGDVFLDRIDALLSERGLPAASASVGRSLSTDAVRDGEGGGEEAELRKLTAHFSERSHTPP